MSTAPQPGSQWTKTVSVEVVSILVNTDGSEWVAYTVTSAAKPYLAVMPVGQFVSEYGA
jgi:hypothetical protein